MQEVIDRVVNHLLLVGDGCQLDVIGNVLLDVSQLLVDICTHLRHVLTFLDFHRQEQALRAVAGDKGRLLGIFALDGSYILQSHIVALAVCIDQGVLNIVNLVESMIHVDGRLIAIVLHTAGCRHESLASQHLCNGQVADAVV